jgi:hypothetical protein
MPTKKTGCYALGVIREGIVYIIPPDKPYTLSETKIVMNHVKESKIARMNKNDKFIPVRIK